ncbi:MAG: hypothetical protein LBL96_05765 [Clostridiales bacterium]|nr:hypothetical protein [Clostridiales bacterium]
MHKFTSGLLAGTIIGAAGIALFLSDDRTRRHMAHNGRRALRKCNHFIDNVHDIF